MKKSGGVLRGYDRILVVDDHQIVLDTVKTLLESSGYSVLCTQYPKVAIQIACEHANKFDLLITDIHMPDMTGLDLAKCLLADYSNMKCIYMSACSNEAISLPDAHFIQKPFSATDLITKVREMLD